MANKLTNKDVVTEWAKIPDSIVQEFGEKGDFARQHLLTPNLFNLLGDIKGKAVLDAYSGTGYLSRMMARKGANVTGIEMSPKLLSYALEKEKKEQLGITYKAGVISDFTFTKLFDIVLASMVFMNWPDFETPMRSCINAVKKNGTFIFSINHPCFEMSGKEWRQVGYVKVKEYFEEYATKPIFGHKFHRPLSMYINFLADNGCSIEKMIEPKLTHKEVGDEVDYAKDVHVPSFLIIKARKLR